MIEWVINIPKTLYMHVFPGASYLWFARQPQDLEIKAETFSFRFLCSLLVVEDFSTMILSCRMARNNFGLGVSLRFCRQWDPGAFSNAFFAKCTLGVICINLFEWGGGWGGNVLTFYCQSKGVVKEGNCSEGRIFLGLVDGWSNFTSQGPIYSTALANPKTHLVNWKGLPDQYNISVICVCSCSFRNQCNIFEI